MLLTIIQGKATIHSYQTLESIIEFIKSNRQVERFKSLRNKYKADKLVYQSDRDTLPSFIVSGEFKGTISKCGLKKYSQLLILDVDKIGQDMLCIKKDVITSCAYTRACFISPSGDGLKIVVAIDSNEERHGIAYNQVVDYYEKLIGFKVDTSGRNINRKCFISHDSNAYYNEHSTVFHVDLTWHAREVDLFTGDIVIPVVEVVPKYKTGMYWEC